MLIVIYIISHNVCYAIFEDGFLGLCAGDELPIDR